MALITLDLSRLPLSARKTFDEVMRNETCANIVRAKKNQREIAAYFRAHPPRAIEGIGGQTMAFDPFVWSALRRVCNAAPGEDAEVQKWAAKRHPELRVRHLPSKLQVGYWSTPEVKPKFRKSYPSENRNP